MKEWQVLAASFIFYLLNITVLQDTLKTALTVLGFPTEWYHLVGLAVLMTLAFARFISPVWGLADLLAAGFIVVVYLIAIYKNPISVVADLLKSVLGFVAVGILAGLSMRGGKSYGR